MNPRDVRICAVRWHALPVTLRLPLKFGHETLTSVVCARVCVTVEEADGSRAEGWGKTPLSVQWVWPSPVPYDVRLTALQAFCDTLTEAYAAFSTGHAIEIGMTSSSRPCPASSGSSTRPCPRHRPADSRGAGLLLAVRPRPARAPTASPMACRRIPLIRPWMNRDLSAFVTPARGREVGFVRGRCCPDYFRSPVSTKLLAWHLVGGLDSLTLAEAGANKVADGYPSSLDEWIKADGLKALKVKLRGNDAAWDFERLKRVAEARPAARRRALRRRTSTAP
jgi:hypothetical protein